MSVEDIRAIVEPTSCPACNMPLKPGPGWQCQACGQIDAFCPDIQVVLELLGEYAKVVKTLEDIASTHGDSWQEIGADKNEAEALAAASMRANARVCLTHSSEYVKLAKDVRAAMIMMCNAGDMNKKEIHDAAERKKGLGNKYLHHQEGEYESGN